MLKRPKISKTPSVAIRQALDDLAAVEKLKKTYVVDMAGYHIPTDGKCSVCLAGAMIAKAGNDPTTKVDPDSFGTEIAERLYGIDRFRVGNIESALEHFRKEKPRYLAANIDMEEYDDNPKVFKKQMNQLADTLEKLGL